MAKQPRHKKHFQRVPKKTRSVAVDYAVTTTISRAFQQAIRVEKLIPSHHNLFDLCDALRKIGKLKALEVLEKALYATETMNGSALIRCGLITLGLSNEDFSKLREADRKFSWVKPYTRQDTRSLPRLRNKQRRRKA